MKVPAILLASACAMTPALCAAQQSASVMSLKATTVNLARSPFAGHYSLQGKPGCDAAGNVYTRPYDAPTTRDWKRFNQLPIHEVSPAGAQVGNFWMADTLPEGAGMAVAVGLDGRVYQIVHTLGVVDAYYVVERAQNGSVESETKLETGSDFSSKYFRGSVFHLAVFKSGEYLLAGTTGKDGHGRTPYTAVFAADGRLVKAIHEPEDEEARQKADLGDLDYAPDHVGNRFVSLGDVAAGSDGNVYVLRATPRGALTLIYVISPSGDIVRKLRIDAGDNDLVARSIRSYSGRLAIGFGSRIQIGPYRVKIVDLQGNSVGDYSVAYSEAFVGDEGLDLACYDSTGLTLVPDSSESKSYVLRARLP